MLVLGDGYGQDGGAIQLVPLSDATELSELHPDRLDGEVVSRPGGGAVRLIAYLLPQAARDLYGRLGESQESRDSGRWPPQELDT